MKFVGGSGTGMRGANRVERSRFCLLLASSSVAALLVGGGAPSAYAACTPVTAAFTNPAGVTIACVTVNNQAFSGSVVNAGKITPGSPTGILVENGSSIAGTISNGGVITVSGNGIVIENSVVTNGIANSNEISTGDFGIVVGGIVPANASLSLSSFGGGINNSGTIVVSATGVAGVLVGSVIANGGSSKISTFSGGISNSGTIDASSTSGNETYGVLVGGVALANATIAISSFSGNIVNAGTITTKDGSGILIGGEVLANGSSGSITVDAFTGNIENLSGATVSGVNGIGVGGEAFSSGSLTISSFIGAITNAGVIPAAADGYGIYVGGLAVSGGILKVEEFSGGIANSGRISGDYGIMVGGLSVSQDSTIVVSSFGGGISNSGVIIADAIGILVGGDGILGGSFTISTFSGGISNSGTIHSGSAGGIVVGGTAISEAGAVSNFSGNIINTGAITALGAVTTTGQGTGIFVGGKAFSTTLTIGTFTGNIENQSGGTISARDGIWIGGVVVTNASLTISTFAGGITNAGVISTAGTVVNDTGNGIYVGGLAVSGGILKIDEFSGGIVNSGTISAVNDGINIGGIPVTSGVVSVSSFGGGISNSGTIIAAAAGIMIGGDVIQGGNFTLSTFSGGISNSGTIHAGAGGIVVGGTAEAGTIAITAFSGNIANTGTILATGTGILLGSSDVTGVPSTVTIGTFAGTIDNQSGATISAGQNGIWVGGSLRAQGSGQHAVTAVTISTFGGITNGGVIVSGGNGVWIGGTADAINRTSNTAVVAIATFASGVANSGTITAAGNGIWVGGDASVTGGTNNRAAVTISTFDGGVSNSGTISAGGIGIFIGGAATVSGGVGGTASVTISTFSGGIANSGLIAGHTGIVVGAGVLTFVGAIANSGTISGAGGTAIDVSAANNAITIGQTGGLISGSIKLSANADQLNISGGTINGNVVGQGLDDITFALGSGTFTYGSAFGFSGISRVTVDSGTVILSGTNQATNTTVSGGTLVVGDASDLGALLQTNAVTVSGGTLAGDGTIDPGGTTVTINSGATLAPGASGAIGTLTIAGSLSISAGSFYDVSVNDTAASKTLVNGVSGTATINGGTVVVVKPQYTLGAHGGTTFAILTAVNGSSGAFSGLVANAANFTGTLSLSYDADDVYLNVGRGFEILPQPNGGNLNQRDVAAGINNAIIAGDTVPASFNQLLGLSNTAYLNALSQLDGEDATGAQRSAFDLMNEFLGLMLDPFVNGRGGSSANGGALGFAADQQDRLPPDIALAYAGLLKAPPPQTFAQRWSAWASGFGGSGTSNGDPVIGSTNVTTSTYGYAAGLDYHFSPDTVFGFSLAGGGTNWNLANALGTGRSDAFLAGLYGVTHNGPWYFGGALAFANNWFRTNRTAFAGDLLSASFQGQSYSARLEGGYRFAVPVNHNAIGVTPYAAIQVQDFHTPSYSETDVTGGGFGLSYNAMNGTDTRSELGGRFDDLTALYALPLVLRAKLAWAHDWASDPSLNAAFESLQGASFTVNGAPIPQNSALTSAGAQLFFTPNWSVLAKFDGEFASGYQLYAGTGTLRYTW